LEKKPTGGKGRDKTTKKVRGTGFPGVHGKEKFGPAKTYIIKVGTEESGKQVRESNKTRGHQESRDGKKSTNAQKNSSMLHNRVGSKELTR